MAQSFDPGTASPSGSPRQEDEEGPKEKQAQCKPQRQALWGGGGGRRGRETR